MLMPRDQRTKHFPALRPQVRYNTSSGPKQEHLPATQPTVLSPTVQQREYGVKVMEGSVCHRINVTCVSSMRSRASHYRQGSVLLTEWTLGVWTSNSRRGDATFAMPRWGQMRGSG